MWGIGVEEFLAHVIIETLTHCDVLLKWYLKYKVVEIIIIDFIGEKNVL